jgi:hypothetical protein
MDVFVRTRPSAFIDQFSIGSKDNPNHISQNLMQAISEKTKTRPMIRVGGTSL